MCKQYRYLLCDDTQVFVDFAEDRLVCILQIDALQLLRSDTQGNLVHAGLDESCELRSSHRIVLVELHI